jgi:hypothetical protein
MFKKGDQVVRIRSWDDKGTFVQDNLTIKSWGKVQGTVAFMHDGSMAEERVYVQHINVHEYAGTWFHAGDPTIDEVGAKLAEEKRAKVIAQLEKDVAEFGDAPYGKAQKANLLKVLGMKPRVATREQLRIEIAEWMAANRG